ncbi:MAG TPA: hypothetical protein DD400_00405 [Rhodospirillaceae bacterium]|nr:hypothetical protein [Rhodospirillaceae bacterium]
MRNSLKSSSLLGLLAVVFMLGAVEAKAEAPLFGKIDAALGQKNLTEVRALLLRDPANVDAVVKGLLRVTQSKMTRDPEFSSKMLTMAGKYAPQITPPTVPVVCADLRRIVEALPEAQQGTPFHMTVVNVAQSFASAPVVVAAGRPNLCEDAWLQAANLSGEALLAQLPGMRSPGLPPVTIEPGIPPSQPSPHKKPSAD